MKKFLNPSYEYSQVRLLSLELIKGLKPEDFSVQPIEDVSPIKWHLGHTTWFFEQFILKKYFPNYKEFNSNYGFIFNSYYENAGKRVVKSDRGNLSRPTTEDILKYREFVDAFLMELLEIKHPDSKKINFLTVLGINHEQQHQELMLYDIKYIFGNNPLFPALIDKLVSKQDTEITEEYYEIEEGIYEVGNDSDGFFYDNEKPMHKVYLHPFMVRKSLITNGEYLEFIESGGYNNSDFWLSDGWYWKNKDKISNPLYWHKIEGKWHEYNLDGIHELDMNAPLSHVSYFEADAFASWKEMKLPTEAEWEVACKRFSSKNENSNLLNKRILKTQSKQEDSDQFFGDAWEWTNSAYLPYPYYKKDKGYLGEYNGKFMINQMVLKGGSWATLESHIRSTYRNFFQTDKRWLINGIRLSKNI